MTRCPTQKGCHWCARFSTTMVCRNTVTCGGRPCVGCEILTTRSKTSIAVTRQTSQSSAAALCKIIDTSVRGFDHVGDRVSLLPILLPLPLEIIPALIKTGVIEGMEANLEQPHSSSSFSCQTQRAADVAWTHTASLEASDLISLDGPQSSIQSISLAIIWITSSFPIQAGGDHFREGKVVTSTSVIFRRSEFQ